ncbi:hypothetical protein ACGIJG_03350 [Lacticaseibacillus rhamnosus]|uniref:hypothetical protein n=1 Tax=Lacticaseibacillus rhamnosus TaxID=47715 RepID=UPI0037870895
MFAIVFAVSFEKTVVRRNQISCCLNIKAINAFYLCMDRAPQCKDLRVKTSGAMGKDWCSWMENCSKDKACLVGQFERFTLLSITRFPAQGPACKDLGRNGQRLVFMDGKLQ